MPTNLTNPYVEAEEFAAKTTVLGHFWFFITLFFSFEFLPALAELIWAIERLTRSGDYAPKGYFNRRKIDWKSPN